MRYLLTLMIIAMFGCGSQVTGSAKTPIPFEDNNHFPYNLTSKKYLVLQTQQQMDDVFAIIHQKSGGNRMAPIPSVSEDETYLIFKPLLKNTNDVEIKEIYSQNDTLFINVEEFSNPQIEKSSRETPNILVKLLKKVSLKKVVINYPKK